MTNEELTTEFTNLATQVGKLLAECVKFDAENPQHPDPAIPALIKSLTTTVRLCRVFVDDENG